jgi:hypothetical protein
MGHVGLRPQHISVLGGFRAQGRTGRYLFTCIRLNHFYIIDHSISSKGNHRRCPCCTGTLRFSCCMDPFSILILGIGSVRRCSGVCTISKRSHTFVMQEILTAQIRSLQNTLPKS